MSIPTEPGWYWYGETVARVCDYRGGLYSFFSHKYLDGPVDEAHDELWGELVAPQGFREKLKDIVECYDNAIRPDYIESYTRELLNEWPGGDDEQTEEKAD